ncbi:MAG: rRNA maturation RNase YbeY [Bryobacterales bacterium]|nr:rRNA maturation RNase YbeY [Bryobacterales bacterium]
MSATLDPEPWHFENRQGTVRFDEGRVRVFLAGMARHLASGRQFSVVVGSDEAVRQANLRFRGVAQTTDVLSFPDGEDGYLGDVMISASEAARHAEEHGHSIETEINTLALHGMLHLNGYDHEADEGEMREAEERLRRKLGLPTGLITRERD